MRVEQAEPLCSLPVASLRQELWLFKTGGTRKIHEGNQAHLDEEKKSRRAM